MDERTRRLIEDRGVLRGLAAYVTAPPDNDRTTFLDRFVSIVSRISMFLILAGVLFTFYEVVMRYVFGSPTLWVNEAVLWLGAMIYMVAGAYTMQRRAHIRITAIYDIVPGPVRLVFDYIALFVIVIYAVFMLVGGIDVAWEALITWERFGTVFDPPIPATIKPLVLIVTSLVAALSLSNLLVDWYGFGRQNRDEAPSSEDSQS